MNKDRPTSKLQPPPKFNLAWLDQVESVTRAYLEGIEPARGAVRSASLGAFPRGCSDARAQEILDGSIRLRKVLLRLDRERNYRGNVKARESVFDVVEAAMELSAAWVETLVLMELSRLPKVSSKHSASLANSRQLAIAKRKAAAAASHKLWREEAIKIWRSKPKLSVQACAETVIRRLKLSSKAKTVADAIRVFGPRRSQKAGDHS